MKHLWSDMQLGVSLQLHPMAPVPACLLPAVIAIELCCVIHRKERLHPWTAFVAAVIVLPAYFATLALCHYQRVTIAIQHRKQVTLAIIEIEIRSEERKVQY